MRRVVVTGIGALTPVGDSFDSTWRSVCAGCSGVSIFDDWHDVVGIRSRLAAAVQPFEVPEHYTRKRMRSMSRAGVMAVRASEMALEDADLLGDPLLSSGTVGVAYGSCLAGSDMILDIAQHCMKRDARGMQASAFTQAMNHSCAANISIFFGLRGRIIPTSTACTSASQGIGYAAESIKSGAQNVMVAGGSEELSLALLLLFDSMYATSVGGGDGLTAPCPFASARDGLVVGEGACSLVLEEYEHARARGARIYAELVGFGTNSDGCHITQPTPETMQIAVEQSLAQAGIECRDLGYIHAHATGTTLGDAAEAQVLRNLCSEDVPIGALKSYLGHTLGACGAIEAALTIRMMREETFLPIKNLSLVDDVCSGIDLIRDVPRSKSCEFTMSNNFAFGGVNTSLIWKRAPC
jgi:3-oxoacyl-[acyl-carrier-protein] synthase II